MLVLIFFCLCVCVWGRENSETTVGGLKAHQL